MLTTLCWQSGSYSPGPCYHPDANAFGIGPHGVGQEYSMRASYRSPMKVRSGPVAASAAAHCTPRHEPPLLRRIRRQPKTRHRAQSTRSRTASASRPAGPPPHTMPQPSHTVATHPSPPPHPPPPHPPPPHPQVESNFPSRRSGKFSESKRETTSWIVVRPLTIPDSHACPSLKAFTSEPEP